MSDRGRIRLPAFLFLEPAMLIKQNPGRESLRSLSSFCNTDRILICKWEHRRGNWHPIYAEFVHL
jgi:hypothetical protein